MGTKRPILLVLLGSSLTGLGCSGGGGPLTPGSEGTTGTAASSTSTGSATPDPIADGTTTGTTAGSTSSTSSGTQTTEGMSVFDLGIPDLPPGTCTPDDPGCGCTAVDMLFVLDVSGSMCSRTEAIIDAFPEFVDELYANLDPGVSLHVGLTTSVFDVTDDSHGDGIATCAPGQSLSYMQAHYLPPDEGMLPGSGIQGRLYEHAGQAFFEAEIGDPADQAALVTWLSGLGETIDCAQSDFEYPASGAAYAVHPINLAGANAGFLRPEGSVLLLFLMSDSDHSFEVDDQTALHDMVVSAKGECGEQCVVGAGLLQPICDPFAYASIPFVEGFPHHLWGSVNVQSQYTSVLGDALVEVVAATCASVSPAG